MSTVELHPDGHGVVVIARGEGYIVDPEDRHHAEFLPSCYEYSGRIDDLLVLGTPFDFTAIGPEGQRWRTRIAADGIRNAYIEERTHTLTGEAYDPVYNRWIRFQLDLRTGKAFGKWWPW